jgi:GDPmannose 4,6-dehydratase
VRSYLHKTAQRLGLTLTFEGEGVNEMAKVARITGDNAPAPNVG